MYIILVSLNVYMICYRGNVTSCAFQYSLSLFLFISFKVRYFFSARIFENQIKFAHLINECKAYENLFHHHILLSGCRESSKIVNISYM